MGGGAEAVVPLPRPGVRNVLITSALPYVNNVPHLGNLVGAVLSADVYARYLRQRDVNCLYICGTDEYGTATETKAQEEGLTPQQICDKYHGLHKGIYDWFEIEFDHFGRTSTEQQTEICQQMFWECYNNGYIKEDTMIQMYCTVDQRPLADRYIRGQCPNCGAEDARGDQCDNCGKLLNPGELVNPFCYTCKSTPEERTVKHLFLDLPALEGQLRTWVDRQSVSGKWSSNAIAMTKTWLDGGLKQRCITRDLKWGTRVPLDGYTDKVFYVWFDAPIGYLSITATKTSHWKLWWLPEPDTEIEMVQFMGKDNIPFHSIVFPATEMATGNKWTRVHHLATTEYLNYEDGKFSKSNGVGVFGNDAQNTNISVEVWRYYLLINRPESADAGFLWTDLQAKNNDELLKNVGNLCSRTMNFIKSSFGGIFPRLELAERDQSFVDEINTELEEYNAAMDEVSLKAGLKRSLGISRIANQYLQTTQPWKLIKTGEQSDLVRAGSILTLSACILRLVAATLRPFLGTSFSEKIFVMLGVSNEVDRCVIPDKLDFPLKEGDVAGEPILLFKNISAADIADLRRRFAGSQAERNAAASSVAPENTLRLEMKVGRVVEVDTIPESETLYLCKVDVGESSGPRQVVAGLRSVYTADELQNRDVVVVSNLQPAVLAGHESQGMIVVAEKKKTTSAISCPGAPLGSVVGGENLTLVREPLLDRAAFQASSKPVRVGPNDGLVLNKTHVLVAGDGRRPLRAGGIAEGGKIK